MKFRLTRTKRFLLVAWKGLKNPQWIALGTLVLATGTMGLWLDARSTSERQLRAYVFASPFRAFNVDNRGVVVQVYTLVGSKGSTFAHHVERTVGVNILPSQLPEKFEDLRTLETRRGGSRSCAGRRRIRYPKLPQNI